MADIIPVSFNYAGQRYQGHFKEVAGASGKGWHLMINGYYRGQMISTELLGLRFTSQTGEFESDPSIMQYFSDVLTAWYE